MRSIAARVSVRRASSFAAALACAGPVSAQATSCVLTDHECVEREYPQVCFGADSKLRLEACLVWLSEIERSPSMDVRSTAAAIFGSIGPGAPTEIHADLDARAAALIHGVLAEDPRHPGALLGFATMADTNEERVRRLRDVVAVDSGNPRTLESLARALISVDGGTLEAAAVYERAYELQLSRSRGDYTWRFARDAMWAYESARSYERADRLRARVAKDYGLEGLLERAATPLGADPTTLERSLQDLCREMAMTLFGARPCLDSIDRIVAAADQTPAAPETARLEQTMSAAMFTAARSGFRLDAVDPGWRSRFAAALERHVDAAAATRLREALSEITVE